MNDTQYEPIPATRRDGEDSEAGSDGCCGYDNELSEEPDCFTNVVFVLILAGVATSFALSWLFGLLTLMAILPAAVMIYCFYLNSPQQRASANINMAVRCFVLGIMGALPVAVVEFVLLWVYEDLSGVKLGDINSDEPRKAPKNPTVTVWLSAFVLSFIVAAFCEESLKYLLVKWRSSRVDNPHGIVVLGLTGALGFASFENLLYVYAGGLGTAISRAVVSVPMHGLTGMVIAAYVACDRFVKEPHEPSTSYFGIIRFPVLLHGVFDFCLVVLVLDGKANTGLYRLIPLIICPLVVVVAYYLYRRLASAFQLVQDTFVQNRFGLLPTDMEDGDTSDIDGNSRSTHQTGSRAAAAGGRRDSDSLDV